MIGAIAFAATRQNAGESAQSGQNQSDVLLVTLDLPAGLPDKFSITIPYPDEPLLLNLEKNATYGKNTRFLIDDGSGKLSQVDSGKDGGYLGKVAGNPDSTVNALIDQSGLSANIIRPGEAELRIEPLGDSEGTHRISSGNIDSRYLELFNDDGASLLPQQVSEIAASRAPIMVSDTLDGAVSGNSLSSSTATLRPERVMKVLEYEIGVEIGSRAFFADSAYGGDLEKAQKVAKSIVGNLDSRYLHGAGIKHRLGTVIIRTNAKTDPLRDSVTATGGSKNSRQSLSAFKKYWNAHPKEVGESHDLAVYHVKSAPSGLAYVNSVGSGNRYATSGGNGATSWAGGTIVHEFGHSWGLAHTDSSGFFYENRPRKSSGENSAGGREYFISVMHGGGNHNIGRLATDEANLVYRNKLKKYKYGDLVAEPPAIKPFGHRDSADCETGKPITIDVIANDYDANNDILDVEILDTRSFKGGKITLSTGTGPGRRNELIYTPRSGFTGKDFFHYTVFDTSGRTDWGAVHLNVSGPVSVDTTLKEYRYDFGSTTSPVESGWTKMATETEGEIFWKLGSRQSLQFKDGGSSGKGKNLTRDYVTYAHRGTLNHKLANGLWSVSLTLGGGSEAQDNIWVKAEDTKLASGEDVEAGALVEVSAQVTVKDGELNLDIVDAGGQSRRWALTNLSLKRLGNLPHKVNLAKKRYSYDFGPTGSDLQRGYTEISPETNGDIFWSGEAVEAKQTDPNEDPGDLNRDFITGEEASVLNHKIANGTWLVAVTMGSSDDAYLGMALSAEGVLVSDKIDSPAGQFSYVDENHASVKPTFFKVEVTDGELNLEFSCKEEGDNGWIVNSLLLKQG